MVDEFHFSYQPAGRRYPLCKQIEDHLRRLIADGLWVVDARLPSRQQLARLYHADISTVQRAITPLLLDGILRADRGGGTYVAVGVSALQTSNILYQPIASSHRTAQPIIGIVAILDPQADPSDWSLTLVRTLERTCAGHGVATQVFNVVTSAGERPLQAVLNDAIASGMNGLAVFYFQKQPAWLETMHQVISAASVPLMAVATEDIPLPIPHTYVDEQANGYQATQHLLEQGYRHIGFVTPFTQEEWLYQRVLGARRSVNEFHDDRITFVTCPAAPYPCSLGAWMHHIADDETRHLDAVLDACLAAVGMRESALIIPNDVIAVALHTLLAQRGIRPGQDIGLISFDDSNAARMANLTSMRTPLQDMADMTGILLVNALQGHSLPLQVRLQAQCITRNSTRMQVRTPVRSRR